MGIPSYFSYIVKNHRNIISKFDKINKTVNNLYLDSNSIIYDCMRSIDYNNDFENKLMLSVCQKIEEYIETINPDDTVYITFDGVAPVAKLEQQRNRRFKYYLENEIFTKCQLKSNKKVWNKTMGSFEGKKSPSLWMPIFKEPCSPGPFFSRKLFS